jgi:S-adenosylmethionine:tRNA ribosyltransferase-isomerase
MKNIDKNLPISSFTYSLPETRIAHFPLEKRDDSKFLVYEKGHIYEDRFSHLANRIPGNSLLVLNKTRVIEARIHFQKESGAIIEIFCLEPWQKSQEVAMQDQGKAVWKCLIGGASKWKHHQILSKKLSQDTLLEARFVAKDEDAFLIEFSWHPSYIPFVNILHEAGAIPLPPYIKRKAEFLDEERYQTIFASAKGSVAAPTAALHFTPEVFHSLKEKNIPSEYVTLHVGAGTFKPVKTETIAEHSMHGEPFSVERKTIEALLKADKIVAVGTTSLRTIESIYWLGLKLEHQLPINELSQWECYELAENFELISKEKSLKNILYRMDAQQTDHLYCRTSLIIIPGYEFQMVNGLVTNFHQPQSTLLLLVAAFIGDDWKKVYEYALKNDFRFLSYGDSSLLLR